MASIAFPSLARKTKLSDGTEYGYIYVPAQASKPTVLLLHGCPSSCYDWRHQIENLPKAGYGVLAPDLLGYGDTDKPEAVEAYRLKNLCAHVDELLSKEGLEEVIGVGHDFGSALLTRLAIHYKPRFLALAFISVGFMDPSVSLDVDAINAATKVMLGFSTFGYVKLFSADHGASLIEAAPKSFDSLMYAADPLATRDILGPEGACEAFLREGRVLPVGGYVSPEEMDMHSKILKDGGYSGPLNWYKALVRTGPSEEDLALSAEEKKLEVPTLMVVTDKDFIVLPEVQLQTTRQWAEKLEVVRLDTAHWAMLEDREGLQKALERWLESLEGK